MLPKFPSLGLAGLALSVAASCQDLGSVLKSNKSLSTFYKLIQKYPEILLQLPSYEGVTIVAPSNEAFDNIPFTSLNGKWDPDDRETAVPILLYHILRGTVFIAALESGPSYIRRSLLTDPRYTNVTTGQNVLINKQPGDNTVLTTSMGSRCTLFQADICFQDGFIQVVDNLLIPPAQLANTSQAFHITSFLAALYAAKLMPDVSERKNVTIFAPVDTAFDMVGGRLKAMGKRRLTSVMKYHIVPDRIISSAQLSNGSQLETLSGDAFSKLRKSLVVRQAGNNRYINSAQIVQPDVLIANGILHIISNVLNPDADSVMPDADLASQPPVFPVSSVSAPFASALPCTSNCTAKATGNSPPSANHSATATTSGWKPKSSKGAGQLVRASTQLAGAGILGAGVGLLADWL